MLALVVQMNTAREINFLDTNLFNEEASSTWSLRKWLGTTPLFSRYAKTKPIAQQMMAHEGGFVFEQEVAFNLSLPAGLTSGIVGMSVFMLIGSLIASETLSTTVLARAIEATRISTSTAMYATTKSTALNAEITPKEKQVSAKKSTPSSSTSTVGTSAVEAVAPKPVQSQLKRDVFGFLPYWFVEAAVGTIDYKSLTSLAYFDIALQGNGAVDTEAYGWQWLDKAPTQQILSDTRNADVRLVMTFSALQDDVIESILRSSENQDRAIESMVEVMRAQKAEGANIDFEYGGKPSEELRSQYVELVRKATERIHAEFPGGEVTVSTTPASTLYTKLDNAVELQNVSDGLFVMAYDYVTLGSSYAGPVAPLTGAPNSYWYDIVSTVKDYISSGVAANKIILGVPYYGYDWPTVDHAPKSEVTNGKRNVANYSGVKKALEKGVGERRWDENAQVPYLVYEEDGVNRIAYYEDVESLGKKYDFINEQNLKGVGLWALGQDGGAKELWELIREKFSS